MHTQSQTSMQPFLARIYEVWFQTVQLLNRRLERKHYSNHMHVYARINWQSDRARSTVNPHHKKITIDLVA